MALKKTVIARLAVLAKVDAAALETAIAAADEQDVVIADDLQVLTKAESDTRDRNKYNEGKTAGTEMVLKEIKTKHAIEVDGTDADKIVEAIGKKAVDAAKISPDEQVKEAKKTADQWKAKATAAELKTAELEAKTTQMAADNKIRALFPKDRSDILTDDELLDSVKRRYEIRVQDGREVVFDRTTNEIVKDKTKLEPVAPGDVVKGYFTERKWLAEPTGGGGQGGRGGGNSNPGGKGGKFAKMSEVRAHVESQGKNPLGQEGKDMILAAIKDNPDIDMNS
jgi:hypothetical protein